MLARPFSTLSAPFDAISSGHANLRPHDERNGGAIKACPSRFSQAEHIVTDIGARRTSMDRATLWTLVFCSVFFGAIASASTHTANPPAAGGPSIQACINMSISGDTVAVNPGTYPERINFNSLAITVKSVQGASNTIIDPALGPMSPHVPVVSFDHGEGPNSVLQDLTIRGGSGDGLNGIDGGGIRIVNNSSPTIDGCIITGNGALFNTPKGGGIYCFGGAPIIKHNTITGNSATNWGGGIYCEGGSAAIIQDNGGTLAGTFPGTISLNIAGLGGGGIYVTGASMVTIDNNAIASNHVTQGSGGGIAIEGAMTTASLTYNQIVSNLVTSAPMLTEGGGGIACLTTDPSAVQILHNMITGNQSGGDGGGIHCYKSSPSINSLNTLTGNVADGCGGGINLYFQSSPSVSQTTMTANHAFDSGGGMCMRKDSNAPVRGCLINGNFAAHDGGGIFIADSSPIVGSTRLIGNGTEDPLNNNYLTQFGGGVAIRLQMPPAAVAPTIVSCSVFANFAEVEGAGIFMDTCTATISHNIISGNGVGFQLGVQKYTLDGGGIYALQGSPLIDANLVIANQVGPNGAGLGAGVSLNSLAVGSPPFTNNIVVQNWTHQGLGGGVRAVGLVGYQLINNTIADNNNGVTQTPPLSMNALYNSGSTLDLWNCIVRGDVNTAPIIDVAAGVTTDNFCGMNSSNNVGPVVPAGWPSPAGAPPQFVNPTHSDYHLLLGSPCIDTGCIPSGGWPPTALKDFDIQVRPNPTTGLPDIGADEYYP
jgi:hypothetical protein